MRLKIFVKKVIKKKIRGALIAKLAGGGSSVKNNCGKLKHFVTCKKKSRADYPPLPLENSFENFSFAGKMLTLFPRMVTTFLNKREIVPLLLGKQVMGIRQQKIYISVDFIHVMI